MLISWNWLNEYVKLDVTPAELAERLMMAGLNHEDTHAVGDDLAINLEVTSNRPDCLGHVGIAREAAVLFDRPLTIPKAQPRSGAPRVAELTQVRVDNPRECPRYTARVVRGVKVGPSPPWLVKRLATIGIGAINNVVDITNYVLMECGQPLHAFDLAKLAGRQIVVRQARAGETFLAINHKTYTLDEAICVIADEKRAVGLGGVMGGADTEVSGRTTELLIEAAEFDPLSIRNTARKLNLHSDSSYRFERGLDPQGVDWASRRCVELILELAGGELAEGVDRRRPPAARARADHAPLRPIAPRAGHRRAAGRRPGASSRPWATASFWPTRRKSKSSRPPGAATSRARSTWSKKSPASMATTRFPRTSACRWPPRTAATSTACRPKSARFWSARATTRR